MDAPPGSDVTLTNLPKKTTYEGILKVAGRVNPFPVTVQDDQPEHVIGYGATGIVWSVTDPRNGRRVALKAMRNRFQSLGSTKRAFREIRMLCFFKHENVLSALDLVQPPALGCFQEIYVVSELMATDLCKILASPQPISEVHVKLYVYQILRGLKYLVSARIIHRDIKPGNLLVDHNCVLKICDFGLARTEDPNEQRRMTQDVVTPYYRAPELLLGADHYGPAIDMWSVGCVFAELLGRRVLFQAMAPTQLLDRITELLGTPELKDMSHGCDGARAYMLSRPHKPPSLAKLNSLSALATPEAVDLLIKMLVFNPDKRITCVDALSHKYLTCGRWLYHQSLCSCCETSALGRTNATDLEPVARHAFDDSFELDLTSARRAKEEVHKFILERCAASHGVPLCINTASTVFPFFASVTVSYTQPPTPHRWE